MIENPESGIEIRVEEGAGERVVQVAGTVSVLTAEKLIPVLRDGVRAGARTVLDAGAIGSVDLCGLQLLCSAHRSYLLADSCFEVRSISQSFKATARAAGYSDCESLCPHRQTSNCVWKG